MCGRYTIRRHQKELAERFGVTELFEEFDERPRFNVAPTQLVPVVVAGEAGDRALRGMRWGFTPSWSKDGRPGPINARGETVASKPMFRAAYKRRRCLLPADGFYEWQARPGGGPKQPWYITRTDGDLFAFAGLWEHWDGDGDVVSCLIITTTPNELMRPIHDRMPVIVAPGDYGAWLGGDAPGELLRPFPAGSLEARRVSTYVNSPRHDDERCVAVIDGASSE